jgi:tetratricopeptide (TPR) repeat protein
LTRDDGYFLLAVDGEETKEAVPVLQIDQQPGGAPNRYRISVSAREIPGLATLDFDTDIEFELTPGNAERIRWYLEDYLQFDEDPAPQIAKSVEELMARCGEELFRKIFEGRGFRLWSNLEPHLSATRVEIATGIAEATSIPWELIRNPDTRTYLALSASSFVRSQRGAQTALAPATEAEKVRILLVICRPKGGKDVPFRSVAGQLVTRLSDDARDAFDIDVLRPPTYEQLAATLHLARERGQPYHIVHFDGHGVYADPKELAQAGKVLSNLKLDAGNTGAHGFLMFEDPDSKTDGEFVDGFRIGALLRDTSVPVLILNACQSAAAEARSTPEIEKAAGTREEVEAYGSLAQAVMDAGAAGVVAMRYSVYVVTAAQFVVELYGALARGRRLGEAVTWARKNLHNQPDRQIAYEPRPLQDWSVPVVWERAPLRLWPEKRDAGPLRISLEENATSNPGALDQALPARPDVGFYGRDETLYALDRAFDTHRVVLLHAYAGSGKTSTAAEFARWYALTGGIDGPVLFTSFERYLPLARVLDKIGQVFGGSLQASGIQWDAINDPVQRRDIALQVLRQIPVLWIWDNVEPVSGFPAGAPSDWSIKEQKELRAFLVDACGTRVRLLLTSRRDESVWLGALVRRVGVPAMPMQERLQLAGAIAARRGKPLAKLPDLRALLKFTLGNPLTLLVAVGEALRAGVETTAQLDAFVEALRKGEIAFRDEESEGRSGSLGASLSYGFQTAFEEDERKILALLHLFQGYVDVDALCIMGDPNGDRLEVVRDLTHERGVALLDRASEIGLLEALGQGYYAIHPALPWYFLSCFAKYFPEDTGAAQRARRSFVRAMGTLGSHYHNSYQEGKRNALYAVAAEESNLLSAWRLARAEGLWHSVIRPMQGLRILYEASGRRDAWRLMVEEVMPDLIDPLTGRPLPGREDEWYVVTNYRISLLMGQNNWHEAKELQKTAIEQSRQNIEPMLAIKPELLDYRERNAVLSHASALQHLGLIQSRLGEPDSADVIRESLAIYKAFGHTVAQAASCFTLGSVYLDVAAVRDLDQAEFWYRESLSLLPAEDKLDRGKCLGQLGLIAFERYAETASSSRSVEGVAASLAEAASYYEQALVTIPANYLEDQGTTHIQLGTIYASAGDTDRALRHYQQAIRLYGMVGNMISAGETRLNAARILAAAGRLLDAREYANAAFENFLPFKDAVPDRMVRVQALLRSLAEVIAKGPDGP